MIRIISIVTKKLLKNEFFLQINVIRYLFEVVTFVTLQQTIYENILLFIMSLHILNHFNASIVSVSIIVLFDRSVLYIRYEFVLLLN